MLPFIVPKYIKITSKENFSLAFTWTLYFCTIVTTSFVSMVHHKSWLYEVIVKRCHYFSRLMLIVCANYIDQLQSSRQIHLLLALGQNIISTLITHIPLKINKSSVLNTMRIPFTASFYFIFCFILKVFLKTFLYVVNENLLIVLLVYFDTTICIFLII